MYTLVSKNVQIGADGTASNNFTIYQPASPDGTLRIGNGNTGTTSAQVVLTSAGNVGIGTSSPAQPLDVVASSSTAVGASLRGRSADNLGITAFFSNDGATRYSQIRSASDRLNVSTLTAIPLVFDTNSTERMRITSAGNVGIGTDSPVFRFDVSGPAGDGLRYVNATNSIGAVLGASGSTAQVGSTTNHPLAFLTDATERARIDSSGNLLVGTTSAPNYGSKLRVQGGIETQGFNQYNIAATTSGSDFEWVLRSGARQLFYVNSASVVANLSLTGVWTNASDARYKENIVDSQYGLATVMALQPRAYNLIGQADKPQIGFIAQEVLNVVPEVVDSVHNSVTDEDRYTLSYGNLVAVLTKAIQEQQAIINDLKARLDAANL
jgi:hypothetical protein